MKEIITKEFIQYKSGFLAGKSEILTAYKLGKIITIKQKENQEPKVLENSWYHEGYQDGCDYFSILIDNQNLNLETINTKDIVKQCFIHRAMIKNQEQQQETPIGKFKL